MHPGIVEAIANGQGGEGEQLLNRFFQDCLGADLEAYQADGIGPMTLGRTWKRCRAISSSAPWRGRSIQGPRSTPCRCWLASRASESRLRFALFALTNPGLATRSARPARKTRRWIFIGKFIVEFSEMVVMRNGRSREELRAYLSRPVDHVRPPYGRRAVDLPRRCVFFGSTNLDDFLVDETGNRRFQPVRMRKGFVIDTQAIEAVRSKLWAAAYAFWDAGEPWHLSPELEAIAKKTQSAHFEQDELDIGRPAKCPGPALSDNC